MDRITELMANLKGEIPQPRTNLSEEQKDQLIILVGGVKTAKNVVKAIKDMPVSRIPFIFNSLDTQAVVDLLANDMTAAIVRAEEKLTKKRGR